MTSPLKLYRYLTIVSIGITLCMLVDCILIDSVELDCGMSVRSMVKLVNLLATNPSLTSDASAPFI